MTTPTVHRLLIPEPPLQVLPSLAVALGLNEAIFLQQLHYLLLHRGHWRDGRTWYYNTYPEWQTVFPFWSEPTIRRIIKRLEQQALSGAPRPVLVSTDDYNTHPIDKKKWYSIDYAALAQVRTPHPPSDPPPSPDTLPSDQIDQMDCSPVVSPDGTPSDQIDQMDCSNRSHASDQIDHMPSDQIDQISFQRDPKTSPTEARATDGMPTSLLVLPQAPPPPLAARAAAPAPAPLATIEREREDLETLRQPLLALTAETHTQLERQAKAALARAGVPAFAQVGWTLEAAMLRLLDTQRRAPCTTEEHHA